MFSGLFTFLADFHDYSGSDEFSCDLGGIGGIYGTWVLEKHLFGLDNSRMVEVGQEKHLDEHIIFGSL